MSDLIDRQQAIDAYGDWYVEEGTEDGFIGTVKQLLEGFPSALSTNLAEVGTGTISRDAVKELLNNNGLPHHINPILWKELNDLPSAQPKRGKWIKTARWGRVYYCDQCRNYLDFDGVNAGRGSTNFCPNCGADMRGEQDG